MVAKPSETRPGTLVAKREVKSALHDDLLLWLIEQLPSIAASRWSAGAEAFEEELNRKRARAASWVTDSFLLPMQALSVGSTVVSSGSNVRIGGRHYAIHPAAVGLAERRSMNAAVGREARVVDALKAVAKPGANLGRCEGYEVMKRVWNRSRSGNRIDAGFVDLVALFEMPTDIGLRIEGVRDAFEEASWRPHARMPSWEIEGLESLINSADSFVPENVKVEVKTLRKEVWFSVRSGAFTLGEVLQELKELRTLELDRISESKHEVALVVHSIEGTMRSHIEKEGFVVVARSTKPHDAAEQAGASRAQSR